MFRFIHITQRFSIFAFTLMSAVAWAAGTASPARSPLPAAVSPGAELRAAAQKAGLPLGPLAFTLEPGAARAGDGVVALITLWSGKTQRQWAVQFEIDPLNDVEKRRVEPFNMSMGPTASGQKIDISAKPTFALKIRALGPYVTLPYNPKAAGKSATDKTARVLIVSELLSIGLDQASRVLLEHDTTSVSGDAKLSKKLRPEDEKAVMGSFVALAQFFIVAQQTPGLKDIVLDIVDLPSVWAFARNLGKVNAGIDLSDVPVAALDPAGWGLPTTLLYEYPFGLTLNGKPAVNCAFFVTAPHPPLLTTAGILGFTAQSPSHKDKHMLVQIVAAYRGKVPVESREAVLEDKDNKGRGDQKG